MQALPLGPGPSYDFAVCPTEQTWFSLRPPGGQGVDITGSLSPTAGGALVFTLFDSDGSTVQVHFKANDQQFQSLMHSELFAAVTH